MSRDDSDAANAAPPSDGVERRHDAPPPKYLKPSRRAVVLMALVAVAGVLLIMAAWGLGPFNSSVVQTDNAYVRGQVTVLAPQVSGYVAEVLVNDFQFVQAGQPLVRIDERIYRQRVAQAEAQLDNAVAALRNQEQAQAQNRARAGAARASLTSAEAERRRAAAELTRFEELAARGAVSLSERDRTRATAQTALANVERARADIAIAEETITSTDVARAGLEAQVKSARAALELARIDLSNTVVKAPRAGQLGESTVRLGQFVTAGSQLMFLVPQTLWVVANFKENQTWKMRVGQPARLSVDAFQGEELRGRVEQLAPATGSEFSVLRPDNASGNFTKVVQRLSVRIALEPNQPLVQRLRPGMSVVARVDTASAPATAGR